MTFAIFLEGGKLYIWELGVVTFVFRDVYTHMAYAEVNLMSDADMNHPLLSFLEMRSKTDSVNSLGAPRDCAI